jgi:DNA-binding NtrC family response regulator
MLRGQHVLIVEDEPLIALDLEHALSSAGAQVGISSTVDSALEAAGAPAVTAAIIDQRLHGQSVRNVVELLATRDLPFIFYSGNAETPTAASWPSVPFLVKPLLAAQVVDMLARVVATKREKPGQSQKGDTPTEKD